jgi:hypothetical protein
MSRQTRVGVGVVGAALALGVLGDWLFQGQALGVNVPIWILAFVAALAGLLALAGAPLHQGRRIMAVPLVLFGALFAWHDSPLLVAANLLALAGAVALGALRRPDLRLRIAGVLDYAGGLVAAGVAAVSGPFPVLEHDIAWSELRRVAGHGRLAAVARGAAVGTPLVVVFGGLFVAADAVFKSFVTSAIPSFGGLPLRAAVVLAFAWLSMGLLRDLVTGREEDRVVSAGVLTDRPIRRSLGADELVVALGLVDLVFLAFVVVQLRYLFGGHALVQSRAHLTYAQYARHGFFELAAVAVLVLPLLLGTDAVFRRSRPSHERLFRRLAGVLLLLLAVVMASALQRMRLYEHEYGLTELRVYVTGVILWLGAVFLWFGFTVLRGRRRFAVGALVAGFAATLALNVLNPDALIARVDVSRAHVDVAYLAGLGDDAVPTLVARLDSLPPPLRERLRAALAARSPEPGWRSWTVSRSRAEPALARIRGS